jgi:hypothetical protein
MKRPIVPRFEPEQIAAEAKARWHGDDEKVATTSLRRMVFEGIDLSSRYDKAGEYEVMLDMVEGLPFSLRKKVESIFCDSKAGLCFSVNLRQCSLADAKAISKNLDRACMRSAKWHNGIYISGKAGGNIEIGADFDLDDFE